MSTEPTAVALSVDLADAAATEKLGAELAQFIEPDWIIYLYGELGAGKTTLVRGLLRQLGYQGNVKSPTYTLLEPYHFTDFSVFHFDLYRIADPDELEFIGLRDLLNQNHILLIEWPQQGEGVLPAADISLTLNYNNNGRIASLSLISEKAENRFFSAEWKSKSVFCYF